MLTHNYSLFLLLLVNSLNLKCNTMVVSFLWGHFSLILLLSCIPFGLNMHVVIFSLPPTQNPHVSYFVDSCPLGSSFATFLFLKSHNFLLFLHPLLPRTTSVYSTPLIGSVHVMSSSAPRVVYPHFRCSFSSSNGLSFTFFFTS